MRRYFCLPFVGDKLDVKLDTRCIIHKGYDKVNVRFVANCFIICKRVTNAQKDVVAGAPVR